MTAAQPFLILLLRRRQRRGKEDARRLGERTGRPGRARPAGKLIWLHAASVGEAQSILSLTAALSARGALSILVTTGTVTSAQLMEKRLPPNAIHQFYPLDRPAWATRFLDHWRPDAVIWTESEIWPAMFAAIRRRRIPAALVNARLSARSYRRWSLVRSAGRRLLETFSVILCQTDDDTRHFQALGARDAQTGGNLKFSARAPARERRRSAGAARCRRRPAGVALRQHA